MPYPSCETTRVPVNGMTVPWVDGGPVVQDPRGRISDERDGADGADGGGGGGGGGKRRRVDGGLSPGHGSGGGGGGTARK